MFLMPRNSVLYSRYRGVRQALSADNEPGGTLWLYGDGNLDIAAPIQRIRLFGSVFLTDVRLRLQPCVVEGQFYFARVIVFGVGL